MLVDFYLSKNKFFRTSLKYEYVKKSKQLWQTRADVLITLENSVFEAVFIVNHVLKVPFVPKVPLITKIEFSSVRSITVMDVTVFHRRDIRKHIFRNPDNRNHIFLSPLE
jgi:hypothetical protein